MDIVSSQKADEDKAQADRLNKERIKKQNKSQDKKLGLLDKPLEKLRNLADIQKSWVALDKKGEKLVKIVQRIEASADNLVSGLNELNIAAEEAFFTAPEVDTPNFAAGPLGPGQVWYYLKMHLIKKGLKSLGGVSNVHSVRSFSDSMNESFNWLMKLRKGDQIYGTIKQRKQQLRGREQQRR